MEGNQGVELTRIDLFDLRQSQTDLVPIQSRIVQLQRIALEVHCVQLLFVLEFLLYLVEARELVT